MRAALLALVLTGDPAAAQDAAAIACHAFTPNADYVSTTVVRQLEGGSVTLRVPREYFEDRWDLVGNYTDTAQLFRVEIGSWEPVTRHETGERNKRGIWNWMTFVVSDLGSLEKIATIAADLSARSTPLSAYPPRSGPHGLAWLDTPYATDKPEPREDVYVAPPLPVALETVISCDSPLDPVSMSPVCTQHFRAAELDVRVSYDRERLAHWQDIQSQVTAFLTCATSEAS